MYKSEYCDVEYNVKHNVVFVKWKSYCHHEGYREPLQYALDIIKEHKCDYVADTRTGFENHPDDTKWVADVFMPKAVEYGCETIYFIIDNDNSLKEELEGQETDSSDKIKFKYIYSFKEIPKNKLLYIKDSLYSSFYSFAGFIVSLLYLVIDIVFKENKISLICSFITLIILLITIAIVNKYLQPIKDANDIKIEKFKRIFDYLGRIASYISIIIILFSFLIEVLIG